MEPIVGDVWSPDLDQLGSGRPGAVCAPVYVDIEAAELAGRETFILQVANRAWTLENHAREASPEPCLVRVHLVALDPPDLAVLKAFLVEQVSDRAPYRSWADFVAKISDLMRWDHLSVQMDTVWQ